MTADRDRPLRAGGRATILDDVTAVGPAGAALRGDRSRNDLVWIDDVAGDLVWAVNPWGIEAIRKDDAGDPAGFGDEGEVVERRGRRPATAGGVRRR